MATLIAAACLASGGCQSVGAVKHYNVHGKIVWDMAVSPTEPFLVFISNGKVRCVDVPSFEVRWTYTTPPDEVAYYVVFDASGRNVSVISFVDSYSSNSSRALTVLQAADGQPISHIGFPRNLSIKDVFADPLTFVLADYGNEYLATVVDGEWLIGSEACDRVLLSDAGPQALLITGNKVIVRDLRSTEDVGQLTLEPTATAIGYSNNSLIQTLDGRTLVTDTASGRTSQYEGEFEQTVLCRDGALIGIKDQVLGLIEADGQRWRRLAYVPSSDAVLAAGANCAFVAAAGGSTNDFVRDAFLLAVTFGAD